MVNGATDNNSDVDAGLKRPLSTEEQDPGRLEVPSEKPDWLSDLELSDYDSHDEQVSSLDSH